MHLPIYLSAFFGVIVITAVWAGYIATNRSRIFLGAVIAWLIGQSVLALTGFYQVTNATPPRILAATTPPLLLILILFITKRGRHFLDRANPQRLTLLHTLRIAVELTLYGLFLYKAVPRDMTFAGKNLDILSGLSAPLAYYWMIKGKSKYWIIAWNLLCLGLLFNVVIGAILSLLGPPQRLAFDQPNNAILYFPFVLLPAFIVPLVLFAHLASIRKLLFLRALPADVSSKRHFFP